MNKIYDKLLLLLGVLALLGGGAFYMLKSGETQSSASNPALQSSGSAYEQIAIPQSIVANAEWPSAEHQSSGEEWSYQVFTPPQIFIDKEGNFTAIPPKGVVLPPPFGIYLADGPEQKPYRLQIQGFSGNPTKPKECVLFFFDEERQVRFFIRPGQTNEEADVEVLDFTIDREIDDQNVVEVTVEATILDKRSGETVKLVDGERLFVSEITLSFASKQDPDVLVELTLDESNPQASFETPQGQYKVIEINLEDKSVTVEKQPTDEWEAETRSFSARPSNQPVTTQPVQETTESPVDTGGFDFEF